MEVILSILALVLYGFLVWAFFFYVAKYVAAVFLVIGVIVAIFDSLHAFVIPANAEERTMPPEPAHRQYFFDRGWRILIGIATRGVRMGWEHVEAANEGAVTLFAEGTAWATWPLGVVAYASLAAATLCGVGFHAAVTLVLAAMLTLVAAS